MKTLKTFAMLAGVIVSLAVASTAKADLTGTTIDLSVTHDGFFGSLCPIANELYVYGAPNAYTPAGWSPLLVTSPDVILPGFDNSITLDFSLFQYNTLFISAPSNATAALMNIADAVDMSSVQVLSNGLAGWTNVASGPAVGAPNGFSVTWTTNAVLAANMQTPNVTIAWNNAVPAPGPLALLGCAGLIAGRRRRRK